MYKIKEAAKKFNVNTNVLRFYEKKKLLNPKRDDNGYRMYSFEDLLTFQSILLYRKMGFSLENITYLLNKKEKPIEMFYKQYSLINHHIHSMANIRESLGECIDFMFCEEEYTESLFSCMKNTADLLAQMEGWEDKWGFDQWALDYDHDIRKPHQGLDFYKNYDKVIQMTADKVNEKTGKVAEIGVGTGNLAAKLMKTQDIIGIDQSINMLMTAKHKFPDLRLRTGNFLELPLQEASMDTVVSSYAFHHCNESERAIALKEMDRVLKCSGRIIITDFMFFDSQERKEFEEHCTKEEFTDLQNEFFTTVKNIEKEAEAFSYSCTHTQIDDLIWMIVLQK